MKYTVRLIIHHFRPDVWPKEKIYVTSTLKVTYEPCKGEYYELLREDTWLDKKVPGGVRHRKVLFSKSPIKIEWDEKNRFTEQDIKVSVTYRMSGVYGLSVDYSNGKFNMTHPVPVPVPEKA